MSSLRILFTNDSPLIKYGLKSGFDNLKHNTLVMSEDNRLWDKPKEVQTEIFKIVVDKFKPDIVFSECFANFAEDIFTITKEKGIFHPFWSIEDTPHEHWIGDYWSNYADYIFTTTAECLPSYWNKGKKAELMLFGVNKKYHRKHAMKQKYQNDISLIANNYDRRSYQVTDFLIPLLEKKYNVSVYGNEWWLDGSRKTNLLNHKEAYKGYMSYEEMPYVYSSSKIALGFNCDGASVTQTSMRMYEVLGVGGALLVAPYTMGQEYLFRDLVYLPRTTDELFLMVDEILSMSDYDRIIKAKQGQRYVYKYHTYDMRAQQVIDAYKYG